MIYTVTLNPAVDRELTVPAIEFDSVLRAVDSRVDFGGKGFNVSRMLAGLGTPSTAIGFAGGKIGELLRAGLEALGIQTDFVWVEGETRTNVSIVSASQKRYVKANEPGPIISSSEAVGLLQKIERLAHEGDWWVLAGSLPPGIPDTLYAQVIHKLKAKGARAMLDTSGKALEHGCRAGPYLAKPNAFEASQLTGLPVEDMPNIIAAATAIQAMGATCVVISLGKEGAMMYVDGQAWIARSPKIDERNPIGAGDSLVGGLVYGLQAGLDGAEALRWGVACGAATASLSGTAVGNQQMVKVLLEQVSVEMAG